MKAFHFPAPLSVALAALAIGSAGLSAAPAYHSTLDVAHSPDGRWLAALDATSPALAILDSGSRAIVRTVPLAGPPAGLVWSADSQRLFVSESGTSRIAEIVAADGQIPRRLSTTRYPRGLALAAKKNLLLAADWGLDHLTVIDLASGQTKVRIPVGRQPTTVAVSRDESVAVVSNLLPATPANAPDHAADVSIIDLNTLKPRASLRLPLGSTSVRGVTISGDGRTAFIVHVLGRFNLPTTQLDRGWVNTNALSIIDLTTNKITATLLLDQVMDGAADPWGVALDPAGLRLYVSLSGVHQLAILDLERLPEILKEPAASLVNDLAALYRRGAIRRVDLPLHGPRGISIHPDGKSLAIAGYFSGNIVFTDPAGTSPATVPLGPQPDPDLARKGEMIFHDANRCFQRWLSCATCHPDGRADGLNWDLLNDGLGNPKNTRSMLWSDRTPPVMSLGVRADMETANRAGFIHILFTQPKDEELQSVNAYFRSLTPITSPHRKEDGSLTESAARGEKLFQDQKVGCAQCHPGPLFTDLGLYDVGTTLPVDRGAKSFDTPTLVESWRNPPYLHGGNAATMRQVLVELNKSNQHGATNGLSEKEIEDLTAYLLSL